MTVTEVSCGHSRPRLSIGPQARGIHADCLACPKRRRAALDRTAEGGCPHMDCYRTRSCVLTTHMPKGCRRYLSVTWRTAFRDRNFGGTKGHRRHLPCFHFPANIICLQLNRYLNLIPPS